MSKRKRKIGKPLGGLPTCPLCLNKMVAAFDKKRQIFVYVCHRDRIAIHPEDPFVGRWDEAQEKAGGKVPCPLCNADMRYFCTSTGFMKALCPKKSCGAAVHNIEVDEKPKDLTPQKPGLLH